jgi:hypothetical protein
MSLILTGAVGLHYLSRENRNMEYLFRAGLALLRSLPLGEQEKRLKLPKIIGPELLSVFDTTVVGLVSRRDLVVASR